MKKLQLLSTVAATLLLAAGAASAQGMKNDQSPSREPATQHSAPAEKTAPSMNSGAAQKNSAGERKAPETTGQAAPQRSEGMKPGSSMDKTKSGMDKNGSKGRETTGQGAEPKGNGSAEKSQFRDDKEKTQLHNDSKKRRETTGQGKAGEERNERNMGAGGKTEINRSSTTTTGQGAAGATKLTTEQRTKITSVIREHKVAPAHLNVAVRVGTRVPDSVHFYPLPVQVIEIYPEWRGFYYILVGDEIVVIDPRTHEIVAVLEA